MRKLTIHYSLTFLLAAGLSFPTMAGDAEGRTFDKRVEREFPIALTGQVEISNRYGLIDIQTWDEETVNFEIVVTVDADNHADAQKFFDRVEISFSNSANHIEAYTEIAPAKSWLAWLFGNDIAEEFSIQYNVKVPKTVRLELSNRYGDIYVAAMQNQIEIDLQYGSLRLDGTDDNIELSLSNCKGSLSTANHVDADISYSSLRIGSVNELGISSRYSRIEIDNAREIDSETKYDNYRINTVEHFQNYGRYDDLYITSVTNFEVESKFTTIVVENLYEEADLSLSNGKIQIKHTHSGFHDITIESSFAPVEIGIHSEATFRYEIYSEGSEVSIENAEQTFVLENVTQREYKGFRGSENAEARVEVYAKFGRVVLK